MNASNYIDRINQAPAIKADRDISKDVLNGRLNAAFVELHRFEQERQLWSGRISRLMDEADAAETLLAERDAEIRRLNQKLFNAHSERARLGKKLKTAATNSEQIEFPKGTGRITQLREYNARYPGVKLNAQGEFMYEGQVVGLLQS